MESSYNVIIPYLSLFSIITLFLKHNITLRLKKRNHLQRLRSSQWRHNGRDGVSNHWRLDGFLNHLFRRRSKNTSKFRITGLCEGNPTVTGGFPSKNASNGEMFPFHDVIIYFYSLVPMIYATFRKVIFTVFYDEDKRISVENTVGVYVRPHWPIQRRHMRFKLPAYRLFVQQLTSFTTIQNELPSLFRRFIVIQIFFFS